MNPETFRAREREAFKIAAQISPDTYDFPPPPPVASETIRGLMAAEQSLKDMWAAHGKILIPAAKNKQPKRYLGILTDKKLDSVLTKDESEGTMEI